MYEWLLGVYPWRIINFLSKELTPIKCRSASVCSRKLMMILLQTCSCCSRKHSVWKSQKKSHSTLRAKRATFTFWLDKSSLKGQKWSILVNFWKSESFGQTVLPDRSILIGQKMVENAKIEKHNCDILVDFQTLWIQ